MYSFSFYLNATKNSKIRDEGLMQYPLNFTIFKCFNVYSFVAITNNFFFENCFFNIFMAATFFLTVYRETFADVPSYQSGLLVEN